MKFNDLAKAADKKYAPLELDLPDESKVVLRLPLRLSREERKAITRAFDVKDEEEKDMLDIYTDVFRIVIEEKEAADKLLDLMGEDLAMYQELFAEFAERMQPGEAGSSKK